MFTSQISGKSLARREMRKICQFDSLANSGPPGGGDIRLTTGMGWGVQGEGPGGGVGGRVQEGVWGGGCRGRGQEGSARRVV